MSVNHIPEIFVNTVHVNNSIVHVNINTALVYNNIVLVNDTSLYMFTFVSTFVHMYSGVFIFLPCINI